MGESGKLGTDEVEVEGGHGIAHGFDRGCDPLTPGACGVEGAAGSAFPLAILPDSALEWPGGGGHMGYSLYIVECADGSLYTGIAVDVERRIRDHNGATRKGARYTAARRPVVLVYAAPFATRSQALKAEIRVKRLTRSQKEALIDGASSRRAAGP